MSIKLTLTESDFLQDAEKDEDTRSRVRILAKKGTDNGNTDDLIESMLPSIIANRVKEIIPENFSVKEISMTISVGGSVFGAKIEGDIDVKFAPTDRR